MLEFFFELLFDGLLVGSEHILTTGPKKNRSKWHWVRWLIVGLAYTIYLAFSALFVFLTWFMVRELLFPKPDLAPVPLWMLLLVAFVTCLLCWRTLRLTLLLYGAWRRKS